ncbi:MAG: hypothetical protein MPL62_13680, partial [Alphaproteobacteria bacterium]|nr:hypothetical protein [Alphaproteobacteria bacterium]
MSTHFKGRTMDAHCPVHILPQITLCVAQKKHSHTLSPNFLICAVKRVVTSIRHRHPAARIGGCAGFCGT